MKTVEKILSAFNLTEYIDSPLFRKFSKEKGVDFFKSKWKETIQITGASRIAFYKKLKHEGDRAEYTDLPFYQRKSIAKIRFSSHSLEIEKGRHKKIEPHQRLCKLCTQKAVEDEEHFLCKCGIYDELRRKHGFMGIDPIDMMITPDKKN